MERELTVRSSKYIVFERKSIPIVAYTTVSFGVCGWKACPVNFLTWYVLSKLSYMKRVIREVLPTERGLG